MTDSGTRAETALRRLRNGLVVSCQATESSPLHGPVFMAAMAAAAVLGGAVGIRADGVENISAIRAVIPDDVPIMGISKQREPDGSVFITSTAERARSVVAAGATLVALDGTPRPRPGGDSLQEVVTAIHAAGGAALADIGTIEHARYALGCGVDAVGTTLSGYTSDSPQQEGPDFTLLEQLVAETALPVFAEGRFWTGDEVRRALAIGASFVVVGTAITNPQAITSRFVAAITREST